MTYFINAGFLREITAIATLWLYEFPFYDPVDAPAKEYSLKDTSDGLTDFHLLLRLSMRLLADGTHGLTCDD